MGFDSIDWGYIIKLILIAGIGIVLVNVITAIIGKVMDKSKLDPALHTFIIKACRILLYVVLVITVLGYLNIPISSLVVGLGAAGAAIALALKDSLSNVAGGILLLVNKPFKHGDLIDVAGYNGLVESIDLMHTTLLTLDNKTVRVPNGVVTTSVLVNYSDQERRRVDLIFEISYSDDIEKAKNAVLKVAGNCENALRDPAPFVAVMGFGENGVQLVCRVWALNQYYWDVYFFLNEQVKNEFNKEGIEIPFNQVDVHVVEDKTR